MFSSKSNLLNKHRFCYICFVILFQDKSLTKWRYLRTGPLSVCTRVMISCGSTSSAEGTWLTSPRASLGRQTSSSYRRSSSKFVSNQGKTIDMFKHVSCVEPLICSTGVGLMPVPYLFSPIPKFSEEKFNVLKKLFLKVKPPWNY